LSTIVASLFRSLNNRGLPNAASMAHCVTQEAGEKGCCHELRSFDISILLVDPRNNFLGEDGKPWPRAKAVAEQVIPTTDELVAQLPA
jgi:hypothetical protein